MEKFVIEGGAPLSGTMVPAGNKNGALPILAASILTDDEVLVRNVPRIRDVEVMIEILVSIGVSACWRGANEVALCARGVQEVEIDPELAESIRASFLLAGPLLARFGRAAMPPPGGDVIGRRRLDPHLDAFRAMGVLTDCSREIVLTAPRGLRPSDVFMDEASVMATENALLAAALTPGTTVIGNAACEPHVQDLARMLVKMGADIQGIGSNLVTVNGAERLHGCEHDVAPDHIEIGSFMALAGVTGGELRIKDTVPGDLRMIRLVFERVGLRSELQGNDVVVPGGQELVVQADVGEYKSKIQDGPWPAFPADLTSIAVALATQAQGSILVHEWMFENRLIFADKLILMGADIVMCDPHRAIITGPRRLRGARVESPDIRAGMAMLLAALCAEGRSEIGNIRQIDRGYERIDERLRELGAHIERVATEPVHA
ncbi:MAG TPA: UDP-N-acetylglucosamine 1-carboxyvinyltransferase [Solirubrobacteraceae bacterium]|jgi:UDP-N-acetylglucosamine 1-carboxyvinyltransferase|nr:UDP-N-acetylglucosamine 1-carboxyvinyltransferase [Solirubrobacteraceae bacterium]